MFSIALMSLGHQTTSGSSIATANCSIPNRGTYTGSTGKYRIETTPQKKSAGFFRATWNSFFTSSRKPKELTPREVRCEEVELGELTFQDQCAAIVNSVLRKHGVSEDMASDLTARYKNAFLSTPRMLGTDKDSSLPEISAVLAMHRLAVSMIMQDFPDHLLNALHQDIGRVIDEKFSIGTANVDTAKIWISSSLGGLRHLQVRTPTP